MNVSTIKLSERLRHSLYKNGQFPYRYPNGDTVFLNVTGKIKREINKKETFAEKEEFVKSFLEGQGFKFTDSAFVF